MPFSSWGTSAALSLDVYRGDERLPLPDGWTVLVDCPAEYATAGYFGSAYISCLDQSMKIYEVVIAHRGTTSWLDGIEDYLVLLGKTPDTFWQNAAPFIDYVKDYVEKNYPSCDCLISEYTGHSLGAVLAELSVARQSLYDDPRLAITFDSPGSKPIIQDMVDNKALPANAVLFTSQLVASDFSDVNAINSCNEQIDEDAYPNTNISPYTYDQDGGVPPSPGYIYYFVGFTAENQHKMINFYNYWKNNDAHPEKKLKSRSFTWPIGFFNSYDYYITYDNHPDYWNGYVKNYWDNHPDIHNNYDESYDNFSDYFINKSGLLKHEEKPSNDDKKVETHPAQTTKTANNFLTEKQRLLMAKSIHEKLYVSVYCGNCVLAEDLLQKGANVNSMHGFSKLPLLHIALLRADLKMLSLLIKFNANVDQQDNFGNTALHLVAKERPYDATLFSRILIQANAKPFIKNNANKTALDIIQERYPKQYEEFEDCITEGYVHINQQEIDGQMQQETRCKLM
jgi:hypothetical protein